jgi:hypothetical protein
MPHFKCVACRIRLSQAHTPDHAVGDLCPECGLLLEPVGALAEVVGYRSIIARDDEGTQEASTRHELMAGRIADLVARREVARARARLVAEPWLDDGGSFSAEAVAVALPLPETTVT